MAKLTAARASMIQMKTAFACHIISGIRDKNVIYFIFLKSFLCAKLNTVLGLHMYRAEKKGLYVVAGNFCPALPCLAPA